MGDAKDTEALDLLERVLSVIEPYRDNMTAEDRAEVGRISALCADLRDGSEV